MHKGAVIPFECNAQVSSVHEFESWRQSSAIRQICVVSDLELTYATSAFVSIVVPAHAFQEAKSTVKVCTRQLRAQRLQGCHDR